MLLDLLNSFYEEPDPLPIGMLGFFHAGAVDEDEAFLALGFVYPTGLYLEGKLCKSGPELAEAAKKAASRHIEPKLLIYTASRRTAVPEYKELVLLRGPVWFKLLEETDSRDREEILDICLSRQQTQNQSES